MVTEAGAGVTPLLSGGWEPKDGGASRTWKGKDTDSPLGPL